MTSTPMPGLFYFQLLLVFSCMHLLPHHAVSVVLKVSEILVESLEEGECTDDNQVLFDAATEASTGTTEDFEEDPSDGVLGPSEQMPLPALGSTKLPFNALAAARHTCQLASRGGQETIVPPHLRRLMWLRWLGVIRGKSPRDWLQELRVHRAEFNQLLAEAASPSTPQETKLRKLIRLDVARCFSEVPRLRCGAARVALRQLLEVQLRRRQDHPAYCQGYHELAAVMLLVCMDGAWPEAARVKEQLGQSNVVDEGDLKVYEELCSAESVPADALVLLEALLYEHRLVDLYEPSSSSNGEEEAVVALRCRRITAGLRRIAPDVAYEIESWGLTPHVLLLRWVRLLFLRELKFPSDVLIAWDAIFADAHCANSDEAAPAPEGVLPSSAALPLVDYLALAMILAAPPSKPEELLHFNERAPEVRKLLAFSWQLRDFANSMPRPSGMRRPGGRPFPQPPAACYPKIGVQKPAHSEKDHRYSMGDSMGGEVLGHALGWAASRLSGAIGGVLSAEKSPPRTKEIQAEPAEPRRNGRRSSDPLPAPPTPDVAPKRKYSFPAEKESPLLSYTEPTEPKGAGEPFFREAAPPAVSAALRPPCAPIAAHRKPRERGNSDETDVSFWPLSPALSEISQTSLSQPRFKGLFSASPLPAGVRAPPVRQDVFTEGRGSQVPDSPQIRGLLPFPRVHVPPGQPFWAPLEPEVAGPENTEDPQPSEPSAEGVMKELEALQAMLQSKPAAAA
ncbi:unnamed protein product [Durusdinium trenchii]|uniref:Rab-GAP TBC domain-containing protein n=1 Tax=Durusdinium trenchii TaxID=1381693 RepID=A0ABP0REC1_9DINO